LVIDLTQDGVDFKQCPVKMTNPNYQGRCQYVFRKGGDMKELFTHVLANHPILIRHLVDTLMGPQNSMQQCDEKEWEEKKQNSDAFCKRFKGK